MKNFKYWLVLGVLVSLVGSSGCYEREIAPAISYDQQQVEQYDEQFKKIEW